LYVVAHYLLKFLYFLSNDKVIAAVFMTQYID